VQVNPELVALVSASKHADLLLSRDLVVAAASDGYLGMMNASRAALVGRPLRQILEGSPVLPDLLSSLEGVLKTGRQSRLVGTFLAARGGGERRLNAVDSPVMEGSSVKWILHSVEDTGASGDAPSRLALEAALQASEARLRSIMQTVPDAMIVIDQRGRIESLSTTAESLFGYTMQEIAGRDVMILMPAPHRERHDGYIERYLETGERRIIGIGRIVVGQRKDGSTFPMHLTVGELRSAGGHYFTGFIRDLTDQQLTESRLKELQSEVTHMSRFTALGEMASTLAHEMNQPLTAINNYLKGSHRLLDNVTGESTPVLRDALAKAAEQALRAGNIIRRLREFVARGESDRRLESLPKMIEDASTLALIGTKENGISVSFRLDPRADLVMADKIQIQQVLVNLIRNAIDELAEANGRRELEIETSCDADSVQVSVADSGRGLAPEVASQLFQPFVTSKAKGMGLGLSICRTIVEAHGGRIWADGRPQGGTIFRFTLPVAGEEEASLVK
jgi:two-component system sensor kinase FixL